MQKQEKRGLASAFRFSNSSLVGGSLKLKIGIIRKGIGGSPQMGPLPFMAIRITASPFTPDFGKKSICNTTFGRMKYFPAHTANPNPTLKSYGLRNDGGGNRNTDSKPVSRK